MRQGVRASVSSQSTLQAALFTAVALLRKAGRSGVQQTVASQITPNAANATGTVMFVLLLTILHQLAKQSRTY
jgi:hypothetical protein